MSIPSTEEREEIWRAYSNAYMNLQPPIEIEVYKPVPAKPGYSTLDYRRKVQDVLEELNAKLAAEGIEVDEGFTNMTKWDDPAWSHTGTSTPYQEYSTPWPEYQRIAVFPVTGNSEGHYIHVSVTHVGMINTIGLAKTFRGWDHACLISARAARLLQA